MKQPKISIVIPVYNAETYLDECVQSILHQTYNDIELILVNDGSKDRSHEICKQYVHKPNVKYIEKDNGGASSARNVGLRNATGQFVMFVDADDFIESTMVEKLYDCMYKNNAQIACCGFKKYYDINNTVCYEVINTTNKSTKETCQMIFNELIGGRGCGSPVCKLYDLSIIEKYNISFDEHISNNEDVLFNLAYFKFITDAVVINEHLYFYRKGQESLSSGYIKRWKDLSVEIYTAKKKILGNTLSQEKELLLQYSWFSLNLIGVINELFCKRKEISKVQRKNNLNWYLRNIGSIKSRQNVIYHSYDYPDRRRNFRIIYPLFAYLPMWLIRTILYTILKMK